VPRAQVALALMLPRTGIMVAVDEARLAVDDIPER
jgi:hypothetical protein